MSEYGDARIGFEVGFGFPKPPRYLLYRVVKSCSVSESVLTFLYRCSSCSTYNSARV